MGLTDAVIAHTRRTDRQVFYDYLFETAKPTFIHTHGNWTYAANLEADPRFRRDYVAIEEHADKWVKRVTKKDMMSGDFVRKEAVAGKEDVLKTLK